jgi:hypothetical protein
MSSVSTRQGSAHRVRWIHGDSSVLPSHAADLATMTGNVAQVFLDDEAFSTALGDIRRAVYPNGRVVFEVRDPGPRAWRAWNRKEAYRRTEIGDAGVVASWADLLDVSLPFVTFRWTYQFEDSGQEISSDSTLRFRSREEVEQCVTRSGLIVDDVRDAPDRPGLEFVFVCSRPRVEGSAEIA